MAEIILPKGPFSEPVPIQPDHDLSGFDCGVTVLNDWLRQRSLKNESRFSRTYVVCDANRVVAFVGLSAGSVTRNLVPANMRRNAPDTIPVAIIGRLAVDKTCAGQGLGSDLLSDALHRIALASQTIGIGAVLVQAKDEDAKRFYLRRAEFLEYPQDSRTLFLPITTLIRAMDLR